MAVVFSIPMSRNSTVTSCNGTLAGTQIGVDSVREPDNIDKCGMAPRVKWVRQAGVDEETGLSYCYYTRVVSNSHHLGIIRITTAG